MADAVIPEPPLDPNSIPASIARHVTRTLAKFTGRGPTKVRAHYSEDCVTVVTEGVLTKGEQTLIDHDHTGAVVAGRLAFQEVFERELVEGIERFTQRPVRSMLSANDVDADLGVEVFLLGSPGTLRDGVRDD